MNPTVKKHIEAGEWVEALEHLDLPDNPSPLQESQYLRWVGIILHRGRVIDEALHEFRAAIAADPTFTPARQSLVNLLIGESYFSEAKQELLAWIAVDPRNFKNFGFLFRIFKELGETEEQEAVLRLLKEHQSRKPIFYTQVAQHYLDEGKLKEASALIEEFLATGRRNAAILELKEKIDSEIGSQ